VLLEEIKRLRELPQLMLEEKNIAKLRQLALELQHLLQLQLTEQEQAKGKEFLHRSRPAKDLGSNSSNNRT
jgi:hypothetical protein